MVYCGKPSKGCSQCRERKIRCDQKEPGCTQCVRASKECSGYRNQLDLMFRDESKSVTRKAKAKARKTPTSATEPLAGKKITVPVVTTEDSLGSSSFQDQLEDQVRKDEDACENFLNQLACLREREQNNYGGGFIRSLVPTAEDLATGFFYTNYVHSTSNGQRGHFDFVPALYSQHGADTHLQSIMLAVGLAGFANTIRAPDLMSKARANYVNAIHLINKAIQSPTSATKDSVLLSIMLLSIFETVTGDSQKSFKAWTEHINGAAALIKLRGHSQFNNRTGVRLFLQLCSNLMISCVQRGTNMPTHILVLRREVAKYVDTSDPSWKISEAILKFIAYRSDVRTGMLLTPESMLNGALAVESSFIQASLNLPAMWQYETVYTTADPDQVWNRCYHIYSDYWIAQSWNALRICRILINEYVRDTLLRGFLESPPKWMDREHMNMFQKATQIELEMRDNILASVPQHTGYAEAYQQRDRENKPFETLNPALPTGVVVQPRETLSEWKDRSALRAAGGYFLIWPLFMVGEMGLGNGEIRMWVVGRLRSIADSMGIMQAYALATILLNREEIRAWDVNDKHIRFEALEKRFGKEQAEGWRLAGRVQQGGSPEYAGLFEEKAKLAEQAWIGQGIWNYEDDDDGMWQSDCPLLPPPNELYPINEIQFIPQPDSEGPLDEQYPIEQALLSQQAETDALLIDFGYLEHDDFQPML